MVGNEEKRIKTTASCTAKHGKLCNRIFCEKCFNKSAASISKCIFWDVKKNGDLCPRLLTKNSHKYIFFTCPDCMHGIRLQMYSVTLLNRWCKFCTNRDWCKDYCSTCIPKTILGHERMKKCWDFEKNALKGHFAHTTSLNCRNKRYFQCDKCNNSFFTAPNDIMSHKQWCPKCKHKTELLVFDWAAEKYGEELVEFQFRRSWLKNPETGCELSLDICIKGVIVEIDGPQHFRQISNWTSPLENQKRDFLKEKLTIKNNMSMIRVLQQDVRSNKINWRKFISETINKLLQNSENPKIVLQPGASEYQSGIYVKFRKNL